MPAYGISGWVAKLPPVMNLLYLSASLAGIALLVGLNFWLLKTRAPLLDGATAGALLALDDPSCRLCSFTGDGRAGVAQDQDGRMFAIGVCGDRLVARPLSKANLARVDYDHGRLRLGLRDPGFRQLEVALAEDAAAPWLARLEALRCGSDERRQAVVNGQALGF